MLSTLDRIPNWLSRDYLPFLRPYLRWTRQPVTWLVAATIVTLLFGLFLQPMGLWLSAGILCVVLLGLIWPWLALRGVDCRMRFSEVRTTEGESVTVTLTLLNRWPWPLWGLAIVGGFRRNIQSDDLQDGSLVETALVVIPAWSESTFRWEFVPGRRGCYPMSNAYLTTGFPFGLWQPRRLVIVENRLVVWPRRYAMPSAMPDAGFDQTGLGLADVRPGETGDFLGVRPYRTGDTLRQIHWPQTAKHGRLIVCERQSPSRPAVRIIADLRCDLPLDAGQEDNLERTIRAAASLCGSLHQQHARLEYCDAEATLRVSPGNQGLEPVLDRLAMIPRNGLLPTTVPAHNGIRRVDNRYGMLEIVVTADQRMARRQQAGSNSSPRCCLVVGDEVESVGQQWEAICREA